MAEIRKAAVIGAGVMGAGIAAHIANAGVPVVLLDIVPTGAPDRSALAKGAIEKMLKADPAPFMHQRAARLITPGNLEDDLHLLADADWIVEAVIERPDVKQGLYRKLEEVRRPGSIVSSNTSTIPLAMLTHGLPEGFARDFLVTHFFNPPRYMRLLEVVAGPSTRPEAVRTIREFCDVRLGKGVVDCKDRPGFIANRLGIVWMQSSVVGAIDLELTVEEADAVVGRPMGIPKTGVFGLFDLVGIDLMPHVHASMAAALPKTDAYHAIARDIPLFHRMIEQGYTGRKGKGGFYRLNRAGGGRVKEGIDLSTGEYRPTMAPSLDSLDEAKSNLRALVEHPDKGGRYAWWVLARTLSYAAGLVPEAADDIVAIDEAMRLGYNWRWGPFELIDKLGSGWFVERLRADGLPVPKLLEVADGRPFYRVEGGRPQYLSLEGDYRDVARPPGVLLLSDVKLRSKPLAKNASAALWDIGDGVVCLEFTSKMNSLDTETVAMIGRAVATVRKGGFKAMVIHNEGANFSVGANLGLVLFAANIAAWPEIEAIIKAGQDAMKALKYAPFPVVGAPSGMALGGGCEVLLHCDAVQAHAETYAGLVEVGVGVVPGWGGCKEMLARWFANPKRPAGPVPPVAKVFETISVATVAKSAAEAKDHLFLRPDDGITMNRDRLLADAKARALAMVPGYATPEPPQFNLPGPTAKAAMSLAVDVFRQMGKATEHDVVVADALADVLSGGDTDVTVTLGEDDLLALERQAFMRLLRTPATLDRMEHMLETGKPLRN
ncbi:MAG: 3-hydroxyacyl-CoA dehydrogenase [Rhodospirillales bacterium]|nr:3-hydroxyacyl-CoA dehydrogenase [Rhodospirillales bacterium]